METLYSHRLQDEVVHILRCYIGHIRFGFWWVLLYWKNILNHVRHGIWDFAYLNVFLFKLKQALIPYRILNHYPVAAVEVAAVVVATEAAVAAVAVVVVASKLTATYADQNTKWLKTYIRRFIAYNDLKKNT